MMPRRSAVSLEASEDELEDEEGSPAGSTPASTTFASTGSPCASTTSPAKPRSPTRLAEWHHPADAFRFAKA
eukprot:9503788-Pyramimonas_sp.AAC.2